MKNDKTNNCISCIHYYITWDKKLPKGCKGFGFKSASVPYQVVREASGEMCKMYCRKEK